MFKVAFVSECSAKRRGSAGEESAVCEGDAEGEEIYEGGDGLQVHIRGQ